MRRIGVALLLLACVLAEDSDSLYFNHERIVKHEQSGDEFYIKKHGKATEVVDLDHYVEAYDSIQDIQCSAKAIRVFITFEWDDGPTVPLGGHYDITQVWRSGMLVTAGSKWTGCSSDVDGQTVNGIHRRIVAILHGSNHIYIQTEKAGFADVFEHAHIKMHHKKGNWDGIPEEEKELHLHRVRRAFMTEDDLIQRTKPLHQSGGQSFETDSNFDWYYQDRFVKHLMDANGARARGVNAAYTPGAGKSGSWWEVFCSSCYFRFEADIHIEISIADRNLQFFEFELSGNMTMQKTFDIHMRGEQSNTVEYVLNTTQSYMVIPIMIFDDPLIKDIVMPVTYRARLIAGVDMKFDVGAASFGFDMYERGQMSIKFRRDFDDPLTVETSYDQLESRITDPTYNFGDALDGSVTLTSEISVTYGIDWGYEKRTVDGEPGGVYRFQLSTNSHPTVSLVQRVAFPTETFPGSGNICTRPTHSLFMAVSTTAIPLTYTVLGKKYWHNEVSSGINELIEIRNSTDFDLCYTNSSESACCVLYLEGPAEKNADMSPEAACGAIDMVISRSMNEFFTKLIQIKSPNILFVNEEHTYSWCGFTNYPCSDCRREVAGYTKASMCADRMMSFDMSEAIYSLADKVRQAYPNRKLRVISAWDEMNSQFEQQGTRVGKFEFDSLHYEGRAAEITISRELTADEMSYTFDDMPEADLSASIMTYLGQLAVSAGMDYVKIESGFVKVGVKLGSFSSGVASGNAHFAAMMNSTYKNGLAIADCELFKFKYFRLYRSHVAPEGKTMDTACGATGHRITRTEQRQFKGLYYYPYDDVMFRNEERNHDWCGVPGRACIDCRVNNDTLNVPPAQRCADRVMTTRMAIRLRKLAWLVELKWGGEKRLILEDGWDEITAQSPFKWGRQKKEKSQYYEARAAWLNVTGDTWASDLLELSFLAQCAGFDFVQRLAAPKPDYVAVCCAKEKGPRPVVVSFPKAQLLASKPGFFSGYKFAYPGHQANGKSMMKEPYTAEYFDTSIVPDVDLGGGFTPTNFSGGERFIRLDSDLVDCLAQIKEKGGLNIKVIAGYRNQPDNLDNAASKHEQERIRHQCGQAVKVQMASGTTGDAEILAIGKAALKLCGNIANPQQRMLGIGIHKNDIYIDFRPKPFTNPIQPKIAATFWDHDEGNASIITDLEKWLKVISGGPPIAVLNPAGACKFKLGEENYYFQIRTKSGLLPDPDCESTRQTDFCKETNSERKKLLTRVAKDLAAKAGFTTSAQGYTEAKKALDDCVLNACGPCREGPIWNKKVTSCLKVFNFYKANSGNAFGDLRDKLTLYNSDNEDAINNVSTIACNKRYFKCMEKTELFGIWAPVVRGRYKPDPEQSVEEELYSGTENPSPIMDILTQMLAMNAQGDVSVFIQSFSDVSQFKKILKILMAYNKDVESVLVYFTKDLNTFKKDAILNMFVNAADIWAGSVCPSKARPAIAPYVVGDIDDVTPKTLRRSKRELAADVLEIKRRQDVHNWELNWIEKAGFF